MKIYTKPAGPMGANTYLLTEDDKTAVAIDCGGEEVWDYALSKGLKIEYVLLTHGHFDHIAGCPALAAKGVKIGAAKNELPLLRSKANLAFPLPLRTATRSPFAAWKFPSSQRRGIRRAASAFCRAKIFLRATPCFSRASAVRTFPRATRRN